MDIFPGRSTEILYWVFFWVEEDGLSGLKKKEGAENPTMLFKYKNHPLSLTVAGARIHTERSHMLNGMGTWGWFCFPRNQEAAHMHKHCHGLPIVSDDDGRRRATAAKKKTQHRRNDDEGIYIES